MPTRFAEALRLAPTPVIMEIKKRDAHGRELFRGRTVPDLVAAYADAGAPCLSVVTGAWFDGHDDLLREVAALTGLPVLKKDFITSRRQIIEAREQGAAAVLLTAELLPRRVLAQLVDAALDVGVTPFVEVADTAALAGLRVPPDCVIAVNNKDIRQRERDPGQIDRSLELLPAIHDTGSSMAVSASAIVEPASAARLLDAGFAGLLVGTALLQTDDVAGWTAALQRCRGIMEHVE